MAGSLDSVRHNPSTMANTLESSASMRGWDASGVQGIMNIRRGEKHGKVTARRRHDKEVVAEQLKELP